MTADQFRDLALRYPETIEASHMNHPDFRVAGKIFATLGYPNAGSGMVKLTPADQARFVRENPAVFSRAAGTWGRNGATKVRLRVATTASVQAALAAAWRNTAPKRLSKTVRLFSRID